MFYPDQVSIPHDIRPVPADAYLPSLSDFTRRSAAVSFSVSAVLAVSFALPVASRTVWTASSSIQSGAATWVEPIFVTRISKTIRRSGWRARRYSHRAYRTRPSSVTYTVPRASVCEPPRGHALRHSACSACRGLLVSWSGSWSRTCSHRFSARGNHRPVFIYCSPKRRSQGLGIQLSVKVVPR